MAHFFPLNPLPVSYLSELFVVAVHCGRCCRCCYCCRYCGGGGGGDVALFSTSSQ